MTEFLLDRHPVVGFSALIAGIFGFAFLVVGVLMMLGNQAAFPGQLAKIEQLRADVRQANVLNSEDVIGQVTEWNQAIRSNQTMNRQWYAGWLIPDEWDGVEQIDLSVAR